MRREPCEKRARKVGRVLCEMWRRVFETRDAESLCEKRARKVGRVLCEMWRRVFETKDACLKQGRCVWNERK